MQGMTELSTEPRVRELVERARESGELAAGEFDLLVADLELSEEDAASLRAQLDELGVELVVDVRELE